jgi:hypothetical protein
MSQRKKELFSDGRHSHNYIEREIRHCLCGCNTSFECKINSKKKYINGHYIQTVKGRMEQRNRNLGKKQSKEVVLRRVSSILKRLNNGQPTTYEDRLINLISTNNLPYKFVGQGDFWITSEGKHCNPDFVNTNGLKVVIEVFADFYKIRQYGSIENYITERRRLFGNFGYSVLFINSKDLKREDWKTNILSKLKLLEGSLLTKKEK